MKRETKIFMALAVGIVAALGVYSLAKAAPPPGEHKFNVGDQITYKIYAPTNVIYQIMAVNLQAGTYDVMQVFQGQLINPNTLSIAVIDANYIKVE